MTYFHYMEACPQLHGKARDYGFNYRKMAVVETSTPDRPKMISTRAKGVVRIVDEVVASVGKTARSYGWRRRQELMALAQELQAATPVED